MLNYYVNVLWPKATYIRIQSPMQPISLILPMIFYGYLVFYVCLPSLLCNLHIYLWSPMLIQSPNAYIVSYVCMHVCMYDYLVSYATYLPSSMLT